MKIQEKALKIAKEYADTFKVKGIIGIVFLGGLARGNFDKFSDIDVVIFKKKGSNVKVPEGELEYKGFNIDPNETIYEDTVKSKWNIEARWAFSQNIIYHDPQGRIKKLLKQKIPLKEKERKWLMMEGTTQSDWYINWLPEQSITRGNILQASYVLDTGIREFLKALFALNHELIPSEKWIMFHAIKLKKLPSNFEKHMNEFMKVKEISMKDIKRRQKSFNIMWKEMLPVMEKEIGEKYEKFAPLI